MRRLLFDTSYTRTQRESVGIVRTVRRLFEEFRRSGIAVEPVVYGRGAFRVLPGEGLPAPRGERASGGLVFRLATSRLGKKAIALLSLLPWPLLRAIWELGTDRAYAAAGQPPEAGDVVLVCDAAWNYASWRAARDARRRGAAVVMMVHDLMPLRHPEFVTPMEVCIFRGWLREVSACSDAMICNSATTEADLRGWAREQRLALPPTGHFRLGADPRTQVATQMPETVRPEVRAFLEGAAPCFAVVGSLEPKKNHSFLLEVFERLWSEDLDARLLVAGRVPSEWRALGERLSAHPERGRRLLPVFDANDAEILAIYAHARALVLPSLMEGFGLPLVEARTAGCPVIASDLPVFQELADTGVFLYPRESALELAARVREHVARDMRASAGRMQPFLWSHSAAQALQVIERILTHTSACEEREPGAA